MSSESKKSKDKEKEKFKEKSKKPVLKAISALVSTNAKKISRMQSSSIIAPVSSSSSLLDNTDSPSGSPMFTRSDGPKAIVASPSYNSEFSASTENSRKDYNKITPLPSLNIPEGQEEITTEGYSLPPVITSPSTTPRAVPVEINFACKYFFYSFFFIC